MTLRKYKYNIGRRKENILRIRIDNETLEQIKNLSKQKGYSMSKLIRRSIVFMLANNLHE